jgi:hypothetical protein
MSDAPWFRRWFGFSFRPISWQGWALTAAFLAVELPIMGLSLSVESQSVAWWLCAALGFSIFLGFWWTVLGRMEG